jgi:hypothetical protein
VERGPAAERDRGGERRDRERRLERAPAQQRADDRDEVFEAGAEVGGHGGVAADRPVAHERQHRVRQRVVDQPLREDGARPAVGDARGDRGREADREHRGEQQEARGRAEAERRGLAARDRKRGAEPARRRPPPYAGRQQRHDHQHDEDRHDPAGQEEAERVREADQERGARRRGGGRQPPTRGVEQREERDSRHGEERETRDVDQRGGDHPGSGGSG